VSDMDDAVEGAAVWTDDAGQNGDAIRLAWSETKARHEAERAAWRRLVRALETLRLDEPAPDDAAVNIAAARAEVNAARAALTSLGVEP